MAEVKKKNSVVGTIVFIVLLAAVIIGVYLVINRDKNKTSAEVDVKVSDAEKLISRNLESDYPATVREVLVYYSKITKCLHSDDLSESQLIELTDKIRALYSEELLNRNDRTEMIGLIKGEIKSYKDNKMSIQSYNVAESGEVTYFRNEDPPRAVINVYFTVKHEEKDIYFERAYEEFALAQDKDGKWKILGWRLTED